MLRANDKKQLEPRLIVEHDFMVDRENAIGDNLFAIEEEKETFGEELVHVLDAISNVVLEYYEAKRQFNAQEISNLFWASRRFLADRVRDEEEEEEEEEVI